MFGNKKKKAENLMATGTRAVGTVTSVNDTGTTINDNPRVKLGFRIDPLDGSPSFDGAKTTTVSRVLIPQVGARYPVWYDASDHETFAFGMVSDQEAQAQIAAMFGDAFGADGSGIGLPAPSAPAPDAGATAEGDPIERIAKLAELHQAGVLTDAEFHMKKSELLGEV